MESLVLDFSERLYQSPEELTFTARVINVTAEDTGCWVQLDDTAFYPAGGGQPADRGNIGSAAVLDVRRKPGEGIFHYCDRPLTKGASYVCQVDRERRQSLSQQHTGEHILSGLINRHFGYNNVGFHLNEVHMTLDFDGVIKEEEADAIELEANRAVWADLPIAISYFTEAEAGRKDYRSKLELTGTVRLVDIPDTDLCACCGTHCRRTGEVGLIKLIGREPWKGGTRLTAVCGDRALKDYQLRYRQGRAAGAMLSTPAENMAEAVSKLLGEQENLRSRVAGLIRRLNDLRIAGLSPSTRHVFYLLPEAEEGEVKFLAKALAPKIAGTAFLFTPHPRAEGLLFIMASDREDVREHLQALQQLLDLKGGGQAGFVQGVTKSDANLVESVLTDYCRM